MPEIAGVVVVVLIGLALSIAVLVDGYPRTGYDSPGLAAWYSQFVAEMARGNLYPRWLPGMNAGLGSPTFFLYPPLAYWITASFELVCMDSHGWCQLGLSAATAIVVSGLTMFRWLRTRFNVPAASLGALVYMVVPYHVSYTLYEAASIASLWAYVWIPVAMLGVERVLLTDPLGPALQAVGSTLLILTNPASATVFFAVPVAYVLCVAEQRRPQMIWTVIAIQFGSVFLAAPYLFPYLRLQQFVTYELYYTEGFFYANHFIDKDVGQATRPIVALAFSFMSGVIALASEKKIHRRLAIGWMAGSAIALYMMLSASAWVWRLLPLLQKLQFPWRFNILLVLSASVLAALAIEAYRAQQGLWRIVVAALCLVMVGSWAVEAAKRERWTLYNNDMADAAAISLRVERALDRDWLRPLWVDSSLWRGQERTRLAAVVARNLAVTRMTAPDTRSATYRVNGDAGEWVTLPQFYFPGWSASGAEGEQLPIKAVDVTGLVAVQLTKGATEVTLHLNVDGSETGGWVIATLTLLLLAVFSLLGANRARPGNNFKRHNLN